MTRFRFAGDVQNINWGMADFMGGFGLWAGGDGILRHTYSMLGVDTS